jgi:colanic acid biosynthesis glycosyl transferase WcaI
MAKILFLSLVFPPDSVSTAQIMGELAISLRDLGHEVEVLTTTPHYNEDKEAEAKQPRQNSWGKLVQKSEFHGIPVYHILMPRKGKSLLLRLLSWVSFHVLSTIVGVLKVGKPDAIIVPSPPLTIGLNAWLLSVKYRAPYIYNVQEIYPDYAVEVGAIRAKWLIKILLRLEKFVYDKAAQVTVIAPYMAQNIIVKGISPNKISVIPNFVDLNDLTPVPDAQNVFSRKYGLQDRFVVSYAGNMGSGQNLEVFINAAKELQHNKDIVFVMMGDGMLRDKLKRLVNSLDLPNFLFLDYQPYSLVPQIYSASNISLVPQSPTVVNVAIPSKVYRIMACACPVLAVTAEHSDLANLVFASKAGLVAKVGDVQSLVEAIISAYDSPQLLREMGIAGRQYVSAHYSREAISYSYHNIVMSIIKR